MILTKTTIIGFLVGLLGSVMYNNYMLQEDIKILEKSAVETGCAFYDYNGIFKFNGIVENKEQK